MRLLIVDDEEATCQGMRVRVQSMNLPALTDIDLAFSAEEALALAQKKEVLLLLTDIRMVDMDGLQLIEELKKQNPCLCSVIMTAHPQFEYAHQAIRLGCKPLTKCCVCRKICGMSSNTSAKTRRRSNGRNGMYRSISSRILTCPTSQIV